MSVPEEKDSKIDGWNFKHFFLLYISLYSKCGLLHKPPITMWFSCYHELYKNLFAIQRKWSWKELFARIVNYFREKVHLRCFTEFWVIFSVLSSDFEIMNHLYLIFQYYLFKSGIEKKLKKNIIKIYSIEKQVCFNDPKKK